MIVNKKSEDLGRQDRKPKTTQSHTHELETEPKLHIDLFR